MRKILLILLTTLLCSVTAWATSYIPGERKVVTSDETINYSTFSAATVTASGNWIVNPRGSNTSSATYTNVTDDDAGNPDGITDNIPTSSSVDMQKIQVPSTASYNQSGKYVIHMRIIGITGLIVHGVTASSDRGVAIYGQAYSNSLTETTAYGSALAYMTRSGSDGSFAKQCTGFSADTEYLITIAAQGGDTYLYAIELIVGASCDAAPTAPTGLSAGSITTSGATFTITDAANTNNYEIYCSTSSTAPTASTVATATGTSKTIAVSGLTPSSTYYAWVRSVCDATYKSAWFPLTGTTFNTADCPSSGTLYTLTAKSTTYSVPASTETNMVSTYATVSGGGAYIGNNSSDAGKAQVTTTGSGTVKFSGNAGYVKLVLDCPIQTGDVLSFVSGDGSYQLAFTTSNERATTYSSTSNTYTFPAAFNGVSTIYVWRVDSKGTFMHSLEITRSGGCSVSSAEAGANKSTTVNTAVALAATAAGSGKTGTWSITSKPDGSTASTSSFSDVNSATATFTMGTADATVTVTFGCKAPTSPSVSGTTAYTEGDDISLTAFATGTSASVTYTWYKGATWDAASATSSIHSGATLSINDCVEGDAGTYWCNISNGTGCDVQTSKTITVSGACTDPELTITLN